MPAPAAPSLRRDVVSAYAVVAARLMAWVAVSAAVYRQLGLQAFALLALVRSTVGVLSYTSLGLAPAMVRMLAEASAAPSAPSGPVPAIPVEAPVTGVRPEGPPATAPAAATLAYATPAAPGREADAFARVYVSGQWLALALAGCGFVLLLAYYAVLPRLHDLHPAVENQAGALALFFGLGLLCRLVSDPASSLLQVRGGLALDNILLCLAEVAWAVGSVVLVLRADVPLVGFCFFVTSFALLLARSGAARRRGEGRHSFRLAHLPTQKALLSFGAFVTLGQLADFLYSPIDYVLITRLLDLGDVGVYAPAVQVDSGLLLLVTGLSTVLLPRTASAHAAGDAALVRRYYVRGTLASAALLAAAAVTVWALSPLIFQLWLGDTMPATRAILPLVLVHTVVGGSAAVGRSILLGMGKVKPFTISVLVAGVMNVVLSYVFVRYIGWGLHGIVLGTIVAVVARAGVWTPWYVLRTLRREAER
jgi:O-antigen/teichoic acid export membrane protein